MNHYVYQITNMINGKIYIGRRSCNCEPELDLKYMGSGKYIRHAIKKHGLKNFTKTIIDVCDSLEQANELETLIVDNDFVKRSDTYNLVCGGPNPIMFGEANPNYGKRGELCPMFGRTGEANPMFGKTHSEETRLKMSLNNTRPHYGKARELQPMFGKTHSEESKQKMSKSQTGSRNSQYGKKWIYSIIEEKSVRINSTDDIPEGWLLGRKLKF